MSRILLLAALALALSPPAFAQSKTKQGKPQAKMSYGTCLSVKTKAGLPAARAAQVCQAIMKSN